MPKPNQIPRVQFQDFNDPVFQQHYWQIVDTLNTLAGYNGPVQLSDHIDLQGNRVQNVGNPVDPTDAISKLHSDSLYSAEVLAPKIQPGGKNQLSAYRIINSKTQREQNSSHLNDLMSSPPTANNLLPTLSDSGGMTTVSIPPGIFYWADGSTTETVGKTDVISQPAQYGIVSISCTGNVVTVTIGTAITLKAGDVLTIFGVTPASFNGTFSITSSSGGGTIFTYQLALGSVTGSGGFLQVNGVYYYFLRKGRNVLSRHGPVNGDTLLNRIQANFDGSAIVVVVVITNGGGQISLSGGGGSAILGSPTAGSFF